MSWRGWRTTVCGLLVGVVAAPFLPALAFAQAQDPPPELPGFLGRAAGWYERLEERGVSFKLGVILPGSHLSFGAGLRDKSLLGLPVCGSLEAAWSLRGYHAYDATLGRGCRDSHRTELRPADVGIASMFNDGALTSPGTSVYLHARHRVYPRVDFYGLGQEVRREARTDYSISGPSLDVVVQWQRHRHFGMSGRAGVIDLDLGPGTNDGVPNTEIAFAAIEAPGLTRQDRYAVVGGAATLDFRDHARVPARGTWVSTALWHATGLSASAAPDITRIVTEARFFHALPNRAHVVAVRGLMSSRAGRVATPSPFYLQPTLGGSQTMRGLASFQLRGDAVWTASLEYRWHAFKWVELVPFVDAGAVAARFGNLDDVRPEVTPGIGLRVRKDRRLFARLDLAHGRDGYRFVFDVGAPF